jgi:hypothetical protein
MTNKECVSDLENIKSYFLDNFGGTYPAGLDYAINMINSGDAVQYTLGYQDGFLEGKKICERPRGEWRTRTDTEWHFECNQCKGLSPWKAQFCGVCGADMRKGGTE